MIKCACVHFHAILHNRQDWEQAADACVTVCRLKEVSPLSYFSGTLDIGKQMKIGVKVMLTCSHMPVGQIHGHHLSFRPLQAQASGGGRLASSHRFERPLNPCRC